MKRITARVIDSLEATGKPYFVRDPDLKGFGIKVTAKGQASFIAEGRISRSGTFRYTIGDIKLTSLNEAQAKYHEVMTLAKKGIDPRQSLQSEGPTNKTLSWCLEEHCKLRPIKKTTKIKYRTQIKSAFRSWLHVPVETITPKMIEQRRAELLAYLSENTVNAYLRALKAVIAQADLTSNPVQRMQRKKRISIQSTSTNRDEFLYHDGIREILIRYDPASLLIDDYITTKGEEVHLGQKPEPCIWSASLFLLLIGGRKQDVYNLTWDMVDKNDRVIRFPSSARKENRPHTIPLVGMISDVILSQPKHLLHPKLVFGMTSEMFRTRYDNTVKPILNQTSKALRKTWSEHMELEGYDPYTISLGLNHSQTRTVTNKHYAKGVLAKQRQLSEMYLKLQVRFTYYAFGKHYDIDIKDEALSATTAEEIYFILKKFPTFCEAIGQDTAYTLSSKIRDPSFSEIDELYKQIFG